MSSHPNVLLISKLTPDNTSRKTLRDIVEEYSCSSDDYVKIGGEDYIHICMEDTYEEDMQVSGKEGDLIFLILVTYGYGKSIKWDDLENKKNILEDWSKEVCKTYNCSYEIEVSANYW